jgi:hypothetical protein
LGEETGAKDQSSEKHDEACQGCADVPDGPTHKLNKSQPSKQQLQLEDHQNQGLVHQG